MRIYSSFSEFVPVPYLNKTFKSIFSITTLQKLKVNIYCLRTNLALSEYNYNFNFCRVLIEKIDLKVWLRYGTVRVREQVELN